MSLSETDSNVRNKNLENPQLNPYKNFSSKTRDTKILQTQKSSETKSSLHLPALLYLTTPPVPLNRMSIGGGNRSQEFDRIVGKYFDCNLRDCPWERHAMGKYECVTSKKSLCHTPLGDLGESGALRRRCFSQESLSPR